MGAQPDEFDTVRSVVAATSSFKPDEQLRILRWAAEILGVSLVTKSTPEPAHAATAATAAPHSLPPKTPRVDLRSFIQTKKPKTDVQFSAAVAYYFRFEAPPDARKDYITATDLQSATRLADWHRFQNPKVPLDNARSQGYLDTGPEKATFSINPVGENLIAMVLPDGEVPNGQRQAKSSKPRRRDKRAKGTKRKA